MALKFSTAVRNARLDSIETTIGTGAVVKIRTGTPPADCAAADSGTALIEFTLASDYMDDAASGSKDFSNTPVEVTADATGTAGHYRVYNSAETVCHMQGTVGESGTDMIIDNTSINSGQTTRISSWSITDGNG